MPFLPTAVGCHSSPFSCRRAGSARALGAEVGRERHWRAVRRAQRRSIEPRISPLLFYASTSVQTHSLPTKVRPSAIASQGRSASGFSRAQNGGCTAIKTLLLTLPCMRVLRCESRVSFVGGQTDDLPRARSSLCSLAPVLRFHSSSLSTRVGRRTSILGYSRTLVLDPGPNALEQPLVRAITQPLGPPSSTRSLFLWD